MAVGEGRLKAREFLFLCEELAMAALPPEVPRPARAVMWTILQLHFGCPQAHFEIQPQVARGRVELGLHFEGPPEWNEAAALEVSRVAPDLGLAPGTGWELEEWTASWRRLHRTWGFEHLTTALAQEVAAEAAVLITALHPLVASLPRPVAPAARTRAARR